MNFQLPNQSKISFWDVAWAPRSNLPKRTHKTALGHTLERPKSPQRGPGAPQGCPRPPLERPKLLPGGPQMGRSSFTKSNRAPRHRRGLQNMDSRPLGLDFCVAGHAFARLGIESARQATHLLGFSSPRDRFGCKSAWQATQLLGVGLARA